MSIELLRPDQLMRLHDVRECVDQILRDLLSDPELLELLRIRLCFDPDEMDGCDVIFAEDTTDTSGYGIVAHLFPRLELPRGGF